MRSQNHPYYNEEPDRYRLRRERLKKRRRQILLIRIFVICFSVLIILLAAFLIRNLLSRSSRSGQEQGTQQNDGSLQQAENTAPVTVTDSQPEPSQSQTEAPQAPAADTGNEDAGSVSEQAQATAAASASEILEQARLLAAGYDYDGAIALIQSVDGYENDNSLSDAIEDFRSRKERCVPVDVTAVPHIFYHSLVNDPSRAFSAELLGQGAADGMNAWMTTVDEFDRITQQLYDNGYVYVRLRDLVVQTDNADGSVSFTPNPSLLLPPEKKAIVLSVDDLSYYHSYETASFPDHLVLDENGFVKCHYVDANGNASVGDYDVVPRLNTFLREHPDGSYRGARGLIALTGYDGVFGYRTDYDYEAKANLMQDQAAWLDAHPDFSRAQDIADATVIANALKAEGWEFASHTWGHLSVTGKTAEQLATDNEKWVENVQNIVGPVDTIIFAHGNDIGDWQGYSADNEQYRYYKSAGYNFYCNVDSSVPYWVQITGDYVRQGRIDLDGYILYQATQGAQPAAGTVAPLIDAASVFDSRRPTPVVANGQG